MLSLAVDNFPPAIPQVSLVMYLEDPDLTQRYSLDVSPFIP